MKRARTKIALRVYTHSERQTWRNCHNRHGYAYFELLRPERDHEALRWGTILHRVVARTIVEVAELKRAGARGVHVAQVARAKATVMMFDELEGVSRAIDAEGDAYGDRRVELDEAKPWLMFQVGHYFECTARDWDEYEVLGCELPFQVPLRDALGRPIAHVAYAGMIDLLLFHRPTARVVVADLKGLTSLAGVDRRLQLDEQTTGYLYAARELWRAGKLVTLAPVGLTEASFCGVHFNIVRKAAPAEPSVNRVKKDDVAASLPVGFVGIGSVDAKAEEKRVAEAYKRIKALEDLDGFSRGRVSTAACDTLPAFYEAALGVQWKERGIPVTDEQRAALERLQGKGDTFFRRVESVRTGRDLDRWCSEFVAEQAQIRAAERDLSLRTRNPDTCTRPGSASCPYQPLCEQGEPATTRDGKRVFGYERVTEAHQEIARGKQEKEQWEQRRRERQEQEALEERAAARDGFGLGGENEGGEEDGGRASPEGDERRQGGGSSPETHHGFF